MTPEPRVFLDANVLIRGVTFPRFPYMGWSHASLSAVERRRWSDLEQPFWEE